MIVAKARVDQVMWFTSGGSSPSFTRFTFIDDSASDSLMSSLFELGGSENTEENAYIVMYIALQAF